MSRGSVPRGNGPPPLVVHVVHRFATGGMENGLVHLIDGTPPGRLRHALLCLTEAGPFLSRIAAPGLRVVQLKRPPGHDFRLYGRIFAALRRLGPRIVHTRNLAALEAQIPAALLPGVRRIHGEHGRDVFDIAGRNVKYNLLRRLIRPLVHRYVAVSRDLEGWLRTTVRVPPGRIRQIYNGVDLDRFGPRRGPRPSLAPAGAPAGFLPQAASTQPPEGVLVVGTVGRLAAVKDQRTLLTAFARLTDSAWDLASCLRLVVVGDGELRGALEAQARHLGIRERVWFAGEREDIPEALRFFDLFVLPSLGEGISNTLLEAMASGLPAVATRVGGNPELVEDGRTGLLVPVGRADALAEAIAALARDPERRARMGAAARESVARRFSWERCVSEYLDLYDELLGRIPARAVAAPG